MTVSPKIKIALIVLILLAGCGFIAFAVFFNRATLEVSAEAPFSIMAVNQRSQDCSASPCSMVLAPGHYDLQITKTGFQSVTDQVDLKIGQTTSKTYQLAATPKVLPVGPWNPENLFSNSQIWQSKLLQLSLSTSSTAWTLISNQLAKINNLIFLEINSDASWIIAETSNAASAIPTNLDKHKPLSLTAGTNYFFAPNSDVIYYIAANPDSSLPSLYRRNLDGDEQPELLINFLRTINNPQLIISQDQFHVALIDRPSDISSSLYLIDLQAKTRRAVNQDELISNFAWLPGSDGMDSPVISDQSVTPDNSPAAASKSLNFLVEKINSETLLPNLYLASTNDPETQSLLPISGGLSALALIDNSHVILAQSYADISGFSLLNFDLTTQQTQPVFQVPDLAPPQKIDYSAATHTLYFLVNSTVYSLAPIL